MCTLIQLVHALIQLKLPIIELVHTLIELVHTPNIEFLLILRSKFSVQIELQGTKHVIQLQRILIEFVWCGHKFN